MNKKYALVTIGAVVVAIVVWLIVAAANARAASTIKLSNGKEVSLGQSEKSLVKELGQNLKLKDSRYIYYGDSLSGEAVIFMKGSKVDAIRVYANSANEQKVIGAKIGLSEAQMMESAGNRVQRFDDNSRLTGYKFKGSGAVGYYLTDACNDNGSVVAMILATPGNEQQALPATTKIEEC